MKKSLLFASLFLVGTGFAQEHGMGMVISDEDNRIPMIEKPMGYGANLPKQASLLQYAPEIGNQGALGTCVGWSTTYNIATMEYAIHKGITDRSVITALAYDPFQTYLGCQKDYMPEQYSVCEYGILTADACDFLVENGVKRRFQDNLSCGDEININEQNSTVDFTDVYRLVQDLDWWLSDFYQDLWDQNVTAICQAIVDKHPVVIGIRVPPSFHRVGSSGEWYPEQSEIDDPMNDDFGGHAMTVVGYDDDKNGGSFIVLNSWGEDWGENGVCYMRYDDFNRFCTKAFVFDTKLKYEDTQEPGALYGDVSYGYGVQRLKGGGFFEGEFSDGTPSKGVYFSNGKRTFKNGKMFMKKLVKKNGGTLLFDSYDDKSPIGCMIY